jgi:ADP-ribose pyrophosphatase
MKLKETFVRRLKRVEGNVVAFNLDKIRLPNGKPATREYLDHPGAVAAIPLLPSGKIVMVAQYRFPVREVTWELPAGKLGKREDPTRCVRRELQEETGYSAGRIKRICSFWPTAAFANEVIHIYLATQLKSGVTNPDDDEFLRCEEWTLEKAYRAIQTGKIRDSKTIIGLLTYRTWKGRSG